MIRCSIVGGTGYGAGELLRLISDHPNLEVAQVVSRSRAGKPVATAHPHMRGRTTLRFVPSDALAECDVLFLALPHGNAARDIERWAGVAERIVDLSADFRLSDPGLYEETYGEPHPCPEWLPRFVYGLAERNREELREARYVSGVGCNATAASLALLPLARAQLLDPTRPIVCDVKVGSSEGGRTARDTSHHPERAGVVRSFAPVDHRHTVEVRANTGLETVEMTVTSVELVRGALATCHVWLAEEADDKALWRAYRAAYGEEPFVRVVHERGGSYRHPEPRLVTATNYADVGWALAADGRRLVALCAIDNLVKGAAGSAIQSVNIMHGLDEAAGLTFQGVHPL